MTNWKALLELAMSDRGETLEDLISNTLTDAEMLLPFDNGYGGIKGKPFTAWSYETVYFPVCYEGAEWVGSVARHPDGETTEHQGGPT